MDISAPEGQPTPPTLSRKPRLSLLSIWNMSFGFMGIQFGFALQNANTSRIFETLGANPEDIPILWAAAPLTGLIVQPIIGYLSDRTWHPVWGRRRPFFFIGAVLASLALIAMPNSPGLWIAGGMLWILDASINISMEPFRAFVGDMLPEEQRTAGFAMQSFLIGVGAFIASKLPALLTGLGVSNEAAAGHIPESVKWSYYIGAAAFFLCVLYTILTTKEYPPDDMAAFQQEKESISFWGGVRESFEGLFHMPKIMKQLAAVQFFTWFGLFCMWIFTTQAVTQHIYHAPDPASAAYNEGANFVGEAFGTYNLVAMLFSIVLIPVSRVLTRRFTHMLCLIMGGIGLASLYFIQHPAYIHVAMVGVGMAWASILSMPYAMLSGGLPANRMGYYMGVFNFFIVIPQVVASLGLPVLLKSMPALEPIHVVSAGGGLLVLAGLMNFFVEDTGR